MSEEYRNTYSLQLAAAMTNVSGDYTVDYSNLMNNMNDVKANMVISKPLSKRTWKKVRRFSLNMKIG